MKKHRQIGQLIFEGSFPKVPSLTPLPEVAFVGRSNVGKSSAINVLLQQKKAARVSSRPGRTQMINCFRIEERLRFVDLPGYGFAKVPLSVKERWGKMIEGYLLNSEHLALVIVLVDSRHDAQKMDVQMLDVLRYHNLPFLILATKSDKLKKNALQRQQKKLRSGLGLSSAELTAFSSHDKRGFEEVWQKINLACGFTNGEK